MTETPKTDSELIQETEPTIVFRSVKPWDVVIEDRIARLEDVAARGERSDWLTTIVLRGLLVVEVAIIVYLLVWK